MFKSVLTHYRSRNYAFENALFFSRATILIRHLDFLMDSLDVVYSAGVMRRLALQLVMPKWRELDALRAP